MSGSLDKLLIQGFLKKDLKDTPVKYALPINPEQYTQSFRVKQKAKSGKGSQGAAATYQGTEPVEMRLDFVLDGTGTVYGYKPKDSVPDQIKAFKEVVYNMQSKKHQPRYLKLVWKKLIFPCVLTQLQISYTLFDTKGMPLRAKLSCTFVEHIEARLRVKKERRESPDFTHVRTVTEGDTLPLLVNAVYDDPALYLEVARINGLTNFRRLSVGKDLVFPPVDKSTA